MSNKAVIRGNRVWNNDNDEEKRNNRNSISEQGDLRYLRQRKNLRRVTFKPSRDAPTTTQQFNSKPKTSMKLAIKTAVGNDIVRSGSSYINASKRKLVADKSDWCQITIPHGQKYDQVVIMEALQSLVGKKTFTPHYITVESSAICLFVNDIQVAQTLLEADRQFTLPNGYKMIIRVKNNCPPGAAVDLKEKMKFAMAKRYIAATKSLDLTKFHADVDLKDVFCPLARPSIMLAVIDIIAENVPDLEALDLSDNQLHKLDHLQCLETKLNSLKILHLTNNNITSLNDLDALQHCKLTHVILKGNPLKHRLREDVIYVSEICKKLPSLQKLDFVDLPPQIRFDVTDNTSLPLAKPTFLCNSNGLEFVRQFLEQYYTIFDSDNREPLLAAYDEKAMFSLTVNHVTQRGLRLSSYLNHNCNLLRMGKVSGNNRFLKKGRDSVVSLLSELPATQHDPACFAIDLLLFTPTLQQLTVTGVFRHTKDRFVKMCSFQRTLVLVPVGNGYCIKNEMLHVNYLTSSQIKTAFNSIAPTLSSIASDE